MKRLLPTLLICLIYSTETVPFQEFIVGFWPEYDHPGVLITMEMMTSPDDLPVDLNVILPDDARMALRTQDKSDGTKELVKQDMIMREGQNLLPLHIDQSQFYIQFYYNPFDSSADRHFSYPIKLDKNVNHFSVIIQEHLGGENFTSNLSDPDVFKDEYGFTYHRVHLEGLHVGDEEEIVFNYSNPENVTSVDAMSTSMDRHPEMQNQSLPESSAGTNPVVSEEDSTYVKTLIIGFLLTVLVVGGIMIFRNKEDQNDSSGSSMNKFCTDCGTEVEGDVRFCTKCGKDLDVS